MSYPKGSAPPTSGVCSPSQRRVAEAFHGLALAPFPSDECRRMLRTCQTNRVKLMVAYHVQAHPAYKKLLEQVRGGAIGAPKTFSSDATIRVQDPDDVRLQRRLGGGTVYDLGVPAIFVARTVFDAEPAQVMAMTARMTRRYGGDVDESTVALIRLPDDRLAHLHTSFGEEPTSVLTVFGDEGSIRLTGAYKAQGASALEVVRGGLPPLQQPQPPSDPRRGRPRRLHRWLRRERQVDGQRSRRAPLARHGHSDPGAGGRIPAGRLRRELAGGDGRRARRRAVLSAADRAERRGLRAGREELAGGGQLRDVHDLPARRQLGAALDPYHQSVLRDRRADARRAAGRAATRRARAGAGPGRHRPQHRAAGEPAPVR